MKTPNFWYQQAAGWQSKLLWPLSCLFYLMVWARRTYYRLRPPQKSPVPVIVVGNLVVGGSGKTPTVIALCEWLHGVGYHPGIVSRGYGGSLRGPYRVSCEDSAKQVGDEALLLVKHAPLVIARKRMHAVKKLLAETDCDVVISDDGLQHYAMTRDIEIIVQDARYGAGNGYLLPAGPLREPKKRLHEVDAVVTMEGEGSMAISRRFGDFIHLETGETELAENFKSMYCSAIAGIGHPQQFFDVLRTMGIETINYAYPDHYRYHADDIAQMDTPRILMTEKDAVKCRDFHDARMWYLPMTCVLPEALKQLLLIKLREKT